MSILSDLDSLIYSGDPLPLSWVVTNGNAFLSAWANSRDAELMLHIAAHVVTRQQLVITTCAVVRRSEHFPIGNLHAVRAIETAEAWARGEATVEDVKHAAWRARDYTAIYYAAAATHAADTAYYAADAAREVALSGLEGTLRRTVNSAAVVRKHIHITIADLVRAGKNGWKA